MNLTTLLFEQKDAIGILRLNRPERMNAVIEEMYTEILAVLAAAEKDNALRALILTGSVYRKGEVEKQAFCAGADLKKHAGKTRTREQQRTYIELAHRATAGLYRFPKPVVIAVNGPARGAGAELALNGDMILMAEGATIAFPETGLGTFIGGGATFLLPRLVGTMRARELIYTGRVINGEEAVRIGLALKSCPVAELEDQSLELAQTLCEKAPFSMKLAKEHLQAPPGNDLEAVIEKETESILACMETEDWHEGVQAFAEKRKPLYRGR